MARKPEPTPKPIRWNIYRATSNPPVCMLMGTVEATDADEAIEKGAEQFKQPAMKLIAVRYR